MISKYIMLVRQNNIGGYIGRKSTCNTRIERFWREHNSNAMQRFQSEFEESE